MTARNRIAVLGAGIAGLTCAHRLRAAGREVQVFDKSRGPSGRLSTRRGRRGSFDHGAQYFTARDPRFRATVDQWVRDGLAAPWDGRIVRLERGATSDRSDEERFVGCPGMNAIGKRLGTGVSLQLDFRACRIERRAEGLTVDPEPGAHGPATGLDALVLAMPAAQAHELAAPVAPALAARIDEVQMAPCWAVMLDFDQRLPLDFDGAFVADSPLAWIARNNSKPGRPAAECWVLHASPEWSRQHFEASPKTVHAELFTALQEATGSALPAAREVQAHRWAYSLPDRPLSEDHLFDPASGIGACGDWCGGPRVEGAFLSGLAMAERLLEE